MFHLSIFALYYFLHLVILVSSPVQYLIELGNYFVRIISAASMVEKERSRRLSTSILNQVVQEAIAFKPPPQTRGGKRGRVYYTTQVLLISEDNNRIILLRKTKEVL